MVMLVTERAMMVAHWFHRGQTDMAGRPYVEHLERVARPFKGVPILESIAWLHDVVEDTDCTLNDLLDLWFPSEIVEAVDAITQRPGEPVG